MQYCNNNYRLDLLEMALHQVQNSQKKQLKLANVGIREIANIFLKIKYCNTTVFNGIRGRPQFGSLYDNNRFF